MKAEKQRYLVRVYRDTTIDICEEFDNIKEARKFAEKYNHTAIFKLKEVYWEEKL